MDVRTITIILAVAFFVIAIVHTTIQIIREERNKKWKIK